MSRLESFYVACRFDEKAMAAVFAGQVVNLGYQCRSRWLNSGNEENSMESWSEYAQRDEVDIYESDIFILFTEHDPPKRNSRLVELGYALAFNKAIYIIGHHETIFCTQADELYATSEDCLVGLRDRVIERQTNMED